MDKEPSRKLSNAHRGYFRRDLLIKGAKSLGLALGGAAVLAACGRPDQTGQGDKAAAIPTAAASSVAKPAVLPTAVVESAIPAEGLFKITKFSVTPLLNEKGEPTGQVRVNVETKGRDTATLKVSISKEPVDPSILSDIEKYKKYKSNPANLRDIKEFGGPSLNTNRERPDGPVLGIGAENPLIPGGTYVLIVKVRPGEVTDGNWDDPRVISQDTQYTYTVPNNLVN